MILAWACPFKYCEHSFFILVYLTIVCYVTNKRAVVVNPYSAGIDFTRPNLTSVDVRFWRLKSIPVLKVDPRTETYF